MADPESEVEQLYAVTVDKLKAATDSESASAALAELWERVEDPAMLSEAVRDAGGVWGALLPVFKRP